ncbi:polysaccharide biosynthesis tyrosine autokinase [Roseimaritima ulvae]|uniref:Tyrosine-protein kinase YwqD n=1 Tax=Roseimaritima ulvae TaxID=980254 RepID=A0A5B9QX47_9BACT|nr:polysaccharide biosynthesis tyrosine autokinase [Roseimaritima ulvae]QEG42469.1 Tyrosine-protein kinase YwqD [Roseimaritima ulvae]
MTTHAPPKGIPGYSAGSPGAAPPFQFDPWLIWVTFRRCWMWALPCGLVLAGIAAYVVQRDFVPRYRASHLLEASQDYVLFKNLLPTAGSNLSGTERTILLNSIVLDPVLEDASLRKAPSLSDPLIAEQNLRRNISISSGGAATRMVVSYTDTDQQAAAMVCNAIVDSYLRQRNAFDSSRMRNLERWLEPETTRWEQEVESRQLRVQELSARLMGYAPTERVDAMEDKNSFSMMQSLHSQVANLTYELAVLDAHHAMREELRGEQGLESPEDSVKRIEPTPEAIAQTVANNPSVKEAQAHIARYKKIMLEMEDNGRIRVARDHYEDMQSRRDEWTAKLEQATKDAQEQALAYLNQKADEDFEARKAAAIVERERKRAAQIAADEQERKSLVAKLEIAQSLYDEERERMSQYGGATAELSFARQELEVANDVLSKLRGRVAAIQTERRQDGAVRSLAAAKPPSRPIEKIPYKKMFMASAGAMALPFLLGLLWEFRVRRISDGSTLSKMTGLAPVVGEVSRLPAGSGSRRSRRLFEESIDTLRSNLFLSVRTRDTRSIAVASSMSGEGKSSVASQLAISIAKATGELVLLVDADLRCPDQHDIFGLEMGPGLCGVLSEEATLKDAVDTSLGDLIHVLPAGHLTSSPHRLINPSAMRDFVDRALADYRFVVVDTAPVLAAGETLAVASAVDSTLLCVMRDVSRTENLTRSMRRLEASGANIAGTVFSGVSPREYAYRYGNYDYAIAGETNS